MLRRTLTRCDRLVIVESPNKTAKITSILQSNVTDWTFGQARLANAANPKKGEREGVAVMATIGHFMDTKDLSIDRSDLVLPTSSANSTVNGQKSEVPISTKAKDKKGGKKKKGASSSALLDLPPMPDGAPLLSFKPDLHIRSDNTSMEAIVRYIVSNKNLTEVVLASDPDREGELIAVHALRYLMKKAGVGKAATATSPSILFSRAYIQSITEEGIIKAMRDRQLNYCDFALAESASARHSMDRLFGWIGSSLMRKIDKNFISVGRVQTPALILIRDQEMRIQEAKDSHKASFIIQGRFNIFGKDGSSGTGGSPEVPTYTRQVTFQIDQSTSTSSDDTNAAPSQFTTKEDAEKWLKSEFGAGGGSEMKKTDPKALKMSIVKAPTIATGKQKTPLPHTMQTLLTAASTQLKLSSEDVTKCLQELFQAGLITYPRTDSVRIDDSFVIGSLKPYIEKQYGKDSFVNNQLQESEEKSKLKKEAVDGEKKEKKASSSKKEKEGNVEDAHEALRPTSLERNPADPSVLALFGIGSTKPAVVATSPTLLKSAHGSSANNLANYRSAFPVYKLIYQATLAAFMSPAETETVTVSVGVRPDDGTNTQGATLVAKLTASRLVKAGWRSAKMGIDAAAVEEVMRSSKGGNVDPNAEDEDEASNDAASATLAAMSAFELLSNLPKYLESSTSGSGKGQSFHAAVSELKVAEKALILPKPFSEGTLIQELKNYGVGRPSTYPTIIKTLFDRKYVTRDGSQRLYTTPVGQGVVRAARNAFPTLVDIGFTASFERELNAISKFRVEDETSDGKKNNNKKAGGGLALTDPSNPDLGEGLNPLTCYTLSRLTYSLTGMIDESIKRNLLIQEYRTSNVKSLASKASQLSQQQQQQQPPNGEQNRDHEAPKPDIPTQVQSYGTTSLFERDPTFEMRRNTIAWRVPKVDIPLLLDTIAKGQYKVTNNANYPKTNKFPNSAAARNVDVNGAAAAGTSNGATETVNRLTLNVLSSTYLGRHLSMALGSNSSLHHLGMDAATEAQLFAAVGDKKRLFNVPPNSNTSTLATSSKLSATGNTPPAVEAATKKSSSNRPKTIEDTNKMEPKQQPVPPSPAPADKPKPLNAPTDTTPSASVPYTPPASTAKSPTFSFTAMHRGTTSTESPKTSIQTPAPTPPPPTTSFQDPKPVSSISAQPSPSTSTSPKPKFDPMQFFANQFKSRNR